MGLKDLGKLAKLTIAASGEEKPFEVMFNPESYSEKFTTVFKKRESVNSGVEEYDYVKSMPQDFKLKIILDGTGASEFNASYLRAFRKYTQSVYGQVNEFLRLTWHPDGGAPKPLEITWGKFRFHCRLRDVDIAYTLFNREGEPMRAELDATFIGYNDKNRDVYERRFNVSKNKALAKKSKASADSQEKKPPVPEADADIKPGKAGKNGNGIVIEVS